MLSLKMQMIKVIILSISIGQINVFTDYYPTQYVDSLDSVLIDGIRIIQGT